MIVYVRMVCQNRFNLLREMENISSEDSNSPTTKAGDSQLIEDLGRMFDSQKYADVVVVVGDNEIKAHKCILVARTTYFEAMFADENYMESRENRIIITDTKYNVVKAMLRYIYTSKVPEMSSLADDLLVAADKYRIPKLKDRCAKYLGRKIDKENAVALLILADRCKANQLKQITKEFINENYFDLRHTPGWNEFKEHNGALVAELLELSHITSPTKRFKPNTLNQ